MKTRILGLFIFIFSLIPFTLSAAGQDEHGSNAPTSSGDAKEVFNPREFILEHIADSHEWHILTWKNGKSVAVYLPVIVYSKESGLHIFSSRRLAHGHEYKGFRIEEEGDLKGRIVSVNENGEFDKENLPFDFSMT